MSKSFGKISLGELVLQDKLPIGKLKGCRLCDILETEYEYVIWLENNGHIRLHQEVVAKAQEYKARDEAEQHYRDEVEPWQDYGDVPW